MFKDFRWRAVVATFMATCFAFLSASGLALFISPRGRSPDWQMLALDKHDWQNLHFAFGALFILAGLCHIWLNRRPIIGYIRQKISRLSGDGTRMLKTRIRPEPLLALALCVALAMTAITGVPPSTWISSVREYFRGGGGSEIGGGPPPLAGRGDR